MQRVVASCFLTPCVRIPTAITSPDS